MESYVSETSSELDRLSKLSLMEASSENAMLDCCVMLHAWAMQNQETAGDLVLPVASGWEKGVEGYLGTVGIVGNLSLGSIMVEPLENQTVDALQMGFLGTNGSGRFFISAALLVELEAGGLHMEKVYEIRIAS